MSAPRPVLDESVRAALDEIDHPLSVAHSLRDRGGELTDFRLEFANLAAAAWAGLPRDAMVGRTVGQLLPALHVSGLFDELRLVVETGRPYRRAGVRFFDAEIDGHPVGGVFDLGAMRLGDGYLSAWQEIGDGDSRSEELDRSLRQSQALIPLIRLESRARAALRPGFAT